MEAALRTVIKESLGDYVKRGLQNTDFSSFPVVLRDLQLNEKKVQEEFDETHDSAITITSGKIGCIKVTPGWMGTVSVFATNIEIELSFSATQALKNSMKPAQAEEYEQYPATPQQRQAPPPNCPPRFCCNHDTSDKRVKGDPVSKDCRACGINLKSSYADFQLCPPCSEKEQKCMICGDHASNSTAVAPPAPPAPPAPAAPPCPPRFCSAHDSSEKRVKGEPAYRDCKSCGLNLQSSYADFQLCPGCSEKEQCCMICGSNAPASCGYIPGHPGGPQGQAPSSSGRGGQSDLPPPPPRSGQNSQDGAPNRKPQGDAITPADATQSMYMSQPMAVPGPSMYMQADAWSTQLPSFKAAPQSQRQHSGRPAQGAGQWGHNPGNMPPRPYGERTPVRGNSEDSFAGFLKFVASDLWNTCSSDNRVNRFESPDGGFGRPPILSNARLGHQGGS